MEIAKEDRGKGSATAKPECPYFGVCGGCSLQDVERGEQLERKGKALEEATGWKGKEMRVFSGKAYGYRNRMDMIFHPRGIGFRKKGTWHTPVDVERCAISNQKLNGLIEEVREAFPEPDSFGLRSKRGTLKYAVIRAPGLSSSVSFVLSSGSPGREEAMGKAREFAGMTSAENVIAAFVPPRSDVSVSPDFEVLKGSGFLREGLLGKAFEFPVQGFFQNNTEMAERMHEHVRGILGRMKGAGDACLLDLYGGVGTFGVINSGLFREAVIVDGDGDAIACANRNIASSGAGNARALALGDREIGRLDREVPGKLAVVADPPRAGMHPKAVEWLRERAPEAIVYVSCNPGQLKRDLERLPEYGISSVALFDFFPQTPHMEAVVELEREGP